jgi:hypothetical protein
MSKLPTADLGSDSLHSDDTGYAFMASVWYDAIEDYLPGVTAGRGGRYVRSNAAFGGALVGRPGLQSGIDDSPS